MGHAISGGFLNAKNRDEALKEAYADACEFAHRNGDYEEGSNEYDGSIRYYDRVFNTEDEAEDFFRSIDRDGVCMVKQAGKGAETRYRKRVAKINEKKKKFFEDAMESFNARTSKTISCKACGTRMPNEVARRNNLRCPECRHLLISEGKQKKLDDINAQLELARKQYLKDTAETGKPRYWARYDVHC